MPGFPVRSMHVRGVISDWRLIPVCDWLVCSSLAVFIRMFFLAVQLFRFIFTSILMEVRSLCLDAFVFSVVYCCQYCTSEGLCVLALVN